MSGSRRHPLDDPDDIQEQRPRRAAAQRGARAIADLAAAERAAEAAERAAQAAERAEGRAAREAASRTANMAAEAEARRLASIVRDSMADVARISEQMRVRAAQRTMEPVEVIDLVEEEVIQAMERRRVRMEHLVNLASSPFVDVRAAEIRQQELSLEELKALAAAIPGEDTRTDDEHVAWNAINTVISEMSFAEYFEQERERLQNYWGPH